MRRKNRLLSTTSSKILAVCIVCGVLKTRRVMKGGHLETPYLLQRRKTCGRGTDCNSKFLSGSGNPNYKGYMPTCINCNKRIGYNSGKEMKGGIIDKYCRSCYCKNKRGIYPEQLKPYAFRKGYSFLHLHKPNCKCVAHVSGKFL